MNRKTKSFIPSTASLLLFGRYKKALSGIALSDSLSWDAHKWMLHTYRYGAVLVRDQSDLVRRFPQQNFKEKGSASVYYSSGNNRTGYL